MYARPKQQGDTFIPIIYDVAVTICYVLSTLCLPVICSKYSLVILGCNIKVYCFYRVGLRAEDEYGCHFNGYNTANEPDFHFASIAVISTHTIYLVTAMLQLLACTE